MSFRFFVFSEFHCRYYFTVFLSTDFAGASVSCPILGKRQFAIYTVGIHADYFTDAPGVSTESFEIFEFRRAKSLVVKTARVFESYASSSRLRGVFGRSRDDPCTVASFHACRTRRRRGNRFSPADPDLVPFRPIIQTDRPARAVKPDRELVVCHA